MKRIVIKFGNNKKMKINFIVFIFTFLLMFVIIEAGFRFYYVKTGKIIGIDETEMCSMGVFKQVKDQNNPRRFMPGGTTYYEYWNYSGVRVKANFYGSPPSNIKLANGKTAQLKLYHEYTNSNHMRNLQNFNYQNNQSKLRIAVFGDSFTWGAKVPLKFSYPYILQELIPNSEVLNFGMSGLGIDSMYLRWKYEGINFNPDIVLFASYIDDVVRATSCITKPKFSIENDMLKITNMPPPTLQTIAMEYKKPTIFSYFITHLLYNLNHNKNRKKGYDRGFDLLELMLKEMKSESEKANRFFIVLLIEKGNDHENNELELYAIKKFKKMLEDMQIPYITSNYIFNKENFTPTDYNNMGFDHFSPDGFGFLAQGIKDKLEEENIIEKHKNFYFEFDANNNILILKNKENNSDIQLIIPFDIISEEGKIITDEYIKVT